MSAIKVLGIDHVVLRTSKLQAMLEFYVQLLGCPIERQLTPEPGLVQLRAGNALIDLVPVDSELGRMGGKPPVQNGRNMDHVCLCIAVMDEQDLLKLLDAAGVKHSDFGERYGAEGFGRSIYLDDPEGNVVELKFTLAGELQAAG